MVNRIVVGAHYGLKDWIAQRATAVVMAVYTALIVAVILVARPADFEAWRAIFAHGFIKFASFLFALSLFYHAWDQIRQAGFKENFISYVSEENEAMHRISKSFGCFPCKRYRVYRRSLASD